MRTQSTRLGKLRTGGARRVASIATIAWYLLAAGVSPTTAAGAVPSVDTTIEPSEIDLGDSARLTILTSGSGTISVSLPVVPGLEFRVIGQSRRVEFINGAAIESTSTVIRVTAEEAGVFTIPGLTPKSPPLVLRVNPGHGTGSSLSSGVLPSMPSTGRSNANGVRLTPDGSAFVRLEIPKHEVYVGESIPLEIQVGMRDGFVASINGLPKLNSNDFALNNLSHQPERSAKVVDGKPFTVLTWRSVLSAVKPGAYSLTFETPLTVRIRTRPLQDSMIDDLLGDPFLQNVFGATVAKNLTVVSPAAPFTVLALPAQGKPADFGGAVGSFKISADLSSNTNTAGDPLTLRMHVNGSGNFDRVESSMLGSGAEWKTYEPKSTFTPADSLGFRGEKIFEQPLIAAQPGAHAVPPLSFSFFDPGTRRYETAHSSSLSVTVSPSPADIPANEAPLPGDATNAAAKALVNSAKAPANGANSGLRPDHPETGRVASLVPLYFQLPFIGFTSLLALLFGGGWVSLRRRARNAHDLERQRERERSQITQGLLERMHAASASGDAGAFFNAARSLLQQALSTRWQIPAEQISAADLDARLHDAGADDVRRIFALADEANFSGGPLQAADFERWVQLVHRQLAYATQS